jgi:hypothetical protein
MAKSTKSSGGLPFFQFIASGTARAK